MRSRSNSFFAAMQTYRRIMPYGIVLLMALIFICAGSIFQHPLHRQLVSWKLLSQPEQLTELYFSDHRHLPTTYIPGHAQTFAFTVHNLEQHSVDYQYQIIEQSADGTEQLLASGTFVLLNAQSRSEQVKIHPIDMGNRAKIVVRLQHQGQAISYWVTRK